MMQCLPVNRPYRSQSTVQVPTELVPTQCWSSIQFLSYKTADFLYDLKQCSDERKEKGFKHQLLAQWDTAKASKAFNYDLQCMYKLLDGEYNFSMQLNVERGTLRRKPMRFNSIRQPFNHLRWNFTKLRESEFLYMLRCFDKPLAEDKLDIHVLAVNASPLEKGHSLVVPSLNTCLPQILNATAVRMATDLMLLVEDDTFHVLYNSLLGQASVNHLHMHTLFWPYESDLVNRRFETLCPDVFVIRRPTWFIQAFAFQLTCSADFDKFTRNLTNCALFLTEQNVAHNLFMSRAPRIRTGDPQQQASGGGPLYVTAYLFPRRNQSGAKPPTSFCPASLELAGCLTAYSEWLNYSYGYKRKLAWRFFESATEQTVLRVMDEDAVLPDALFEALADDLVERLEGRAPAALEAPSPLMDRRRWSGSVAEKLKPEVLTSHELDELADTFHTVTSPAPHHRSFSSGSASPRCTLDGGNTRSGSSLSLGRPASTPLGKIAVLNSANNSPRAPLDE